MSTDITPLLPTTEVSATSSDTWVARTKSKTVKISKKLYNDSKAFAHTFLSTALGQALLYVLIVLGILVLLIKALDISTLQEEFALVPKIQLDALALDSISDESINVNVSGQVVVNYSNIDGFFRRNFVKGCAGVFRKVRVLNTTADIYSREKGFSSDDDFSDSKALTASIPVLDLNIANGMATNFSFVSNLSDFGSAALMGRIVQKFWYNEDMTFRLKTNATAGKLGLYVGPVPIEIEQTIKSSRGDGDDGDSDNGNDNDGGLIGFPNKNLIAGFNVSSLSLSTTDRSNDINVELFAEVAHRFALFAQVPSLSWIASVDSCGEKGRTSAVKLLDVQTGELTVYPSEPLNVVVTSRISHLNPELLIPCSENGKSSLDSFVSRYLNNQTNMIHIAGAHSQKVPHAVPLWLEKLLENTELSFELPGHSMAGEKTIRDIKLKNLKFDFPESRNPFQKPTGKPKLSAIVSVVAVPPSLINIDRSVDVSVTNAKGNCSLYSEGRLFANVKLEDWIPCSTTIGDESEPDLAGAYLIEFAIDQAPVEVTDEALFGDVMKQVLWNGESEIQIEADVDGEVHMPIGTLVITDIPASGCAILRAKDNEIETS